jgi:hypothetical protein
MPTPITTVFGALADPTRLAIVERLLAEGERSAGEIARGFAMWLGALWLVVGVVVVGGVFERRIDRQWRVCRVRPEAIRTVDEWMQRYRAFWEGSFDRLDQVLNQPAEEPDNG